MRKLIASFALIGFALGVVGCGGGADKKAAPAPAPEKKEEKKDAAAPAPAKDEKAAPK